MRYKHETKIKKIEKAVLLSKRETFGPRFFLRCHKTPYGVEWQKMYTVIPGDGSDSEPELDDNEIYDDRYYHLFMGLRYGYSD
jgi:hypothetical protein